MSLHFIPPRLRSIFGSPRDSDGGASVFEDRPFPDGVHHSRHDGHQNGEEDDGLKGVGGGVQHLEVEMSLHSIPPRLRSVFGSPRDSDGGASVLEDGPFPDGIHHSRHDGHQNGEEDDGLKGVGDPLRGPRAFVVVLAEKHVPDGDERYRNRDDLEYVHRYGYEDHFYVFADLK
uniref:Uncharacterized protein n=1 Tax=Steinernema glaseri TaxID=37863 RepID=A0A1I8A5C5_9BILA